MSAIGTHGQRLDLRIKQGTTFRAQLTVQHTAAVTHLFAAGSGSTLPATAPTSLTEGTGALPAIYLVE
jgi:hypothetical protein